MDIKRIEIYKLNGKEFRSLREIKTHLENKIGEEVIDEIFKASPNMNHKDKLAILEVLIRPEIRKALTKNLNVQIEMSEAYYEHSLQGGEMKNIFDLEL